ncbi:hypothetical protein COHA_005135 [Chlorella ohadii]|uniref:Beta-hexosaminidase n=1 Tax=Chlorella ohadii TaxID=2649997 RepID=A0AAD5DVL4_9CHLO|nr:hypothetical protein COHA_005135 [Chlorella ohadii]
MHACLCMGRLQWKAVQGFSSDILEEGFDRYQGIIRDLPLGLGRNPRHNNSLGWLDSLSDDELAARLLFEQQDGQAATGSAGQTAGAASRDELAVADGTAGAGAAGRGKRCHLVRTIEVSVTSSDQSLNLETRESYTLDVASPAIVIQANSVFGALRALESLSQMLRRRRVPPGSDLEALVPAEAVWPAEDEEGEQGGAGSEGQGAAAAAGSAAEMPQRRRKKRKDKTVLLVEEVDIYDAPRFRYRGLLIDTARHFLPVSVIKAHLDAMTMVKMNVLHWHLTDDQSFPWETEELPELAQRGSFEPEAVYTPADIKEVVQYARFRGVRVIPELDTPGHTASWGKAYPELLTRCYDTAAAGAGEEPQPSDKLGPINPARNETYGFLWRLIREATRSFPDPYLHLGGDEVDHECWKSNPEVQAFMAAQKWGDDYAKLEGYYMQQVIQLAASAGRAPIVWQEAYDRGVKLPAGTRVQVWKWWKDEAQEARQARFAALSAERRMALERPGSAQAADVQLRLGSEPAPCAQGACMDAEQEAWKAELQAVTGDGYDAILSAPWYLNLGCYATDDWKKYYAVDPTDFPGTTEQKDRVLGGTACAWGEYIDAVNSINRIWPRAAAVAERLWSKDATDVDTAADRLADLRCRMLSRGIAAQSMGPGFCPGELTTRM